MTPEIALVLSILGIAVVFLITEWIPMEVVAFLVMGSLAVSGLTTPNEALSGFSNPAVVTIWSVFILSGGLTRTGVGNIIGARILKFGGRSETLLIVILMATAGLMSAFMNNVAVAALLLPVVMDIARNTGRPPSTLLLPLAYGSLLGGLTTQIGTPPNILVSEILLSYDLPAFSLFDFTPVGGAVFVAGVLFMATAGRRLLPNRNVARDSSADDHEKLGVQYRLQESLFQIRVPEGSALVHKSLAQSRLRAALGLNVIAITRAKQSILAPGPNEILQANDRLVVKGRQDWSNSISNWNRLQLETEPMDIEKAFSKDIELAEVHLPPASKLVGSTLGDLDFRNRYGAMVLAIRNDDGIHRTGLQDESLKVNDALLIQGSHETLAAISHSTEFTDYQTVNRNDLIRVYKLHEHLLVMSVSPDSQLIGQTLKESRLGDALGLRVVCVISSDGTTRIPDPFDTIALNDKLLVEGRNRDIQLLKSLEELEIERRLNPDFQQLVSDKIGMIETVLSPHSTMAGKTLRQIHFQDKYGLNVLAIWRQGRAHYNDLRDMALNFGDALLVYGPREKLQVLGREPDFLVLTETAQEIPRSEKAKLAAAVMAATFVPVILGWIPIYIATVIGAAFMILSRSLTMAEAYRYIEWKAVFLIAGMFPLGLALDQSGAARYLAEGVVAVVGPFGPYAVMVSLVILTFAATCFVPTAALVVLMAPIVMNTSQQLGISPQALMMAIAMAASASFMTPISHPANIMVMGPGGYRFADYIKIGGLLTLVVLIVIVAVLPFFWPLQM